MNIIIFVHVAFLECNTHYHRISLA
uniref:Uncharacterized protein n=1 Tax=Rhizophora mucronata TaxID=61149 RepID=A0A2P2QRB7_RHIMU